MKPEPGDKAPDFTLPDAHGHLHSLKDLLAGYRGLVLYFYPRDDTPGCTTEACGFRDSMSKLRSIDINVVGISVDSPESHRKFAAKYGLNFTLLSDEDGRVARSYNAYSDQKGRCLRKTFIIDANGVIRAAFHKVTADGHAEEILSTIKQLDL